MDPTTVRREVARALGLTFGATLLLAVVQWIFPATASGMQVGLAIVLLTVPGWIMKVGPAEERQLGMAFGPWVRQVRVALAMMAVVFPLFVAGFHVAQTELFDRQADWSIDSIARWDESLDLAPADSCATARGGAAVVWTQGASLWLVAPPSGALTVRVDAAPPLRDGRAITCAPAASAPTVGRAVQADATGAFSLAPGQGLWLSLGERDRFALLVADADGRALPADRIRTGPWGDSADDDGVVSASRDAWWLLTFILVHLGLVALPEEWFFRGYVQARVDHIAPPRLRILGANVGWGLLIGAISFALLHPILLPGVHRLLVFFPALLFGWLRARTGSVGAAILFHAGCNVLLAVVSRMYV